jgi:hypothetical protein
MMKMWDGRWNLIGGASKAGETIMDRMVQNRRRISLCLQGEFSNANENTIGDNDYDLTGRTLQNLMLFFSLLVYLNINGVKSK